MADLSEDQASALEAATTAAAHAPDPSRAVGARELVDMLLAALSPEDALLIRMLEIEELSTEEVHQRTGWSATYIRVRAFRARRKLNQRFGALRKDHNL
jgi:DNA-directed RNA polymerase specialized sigma24 family protein